MTQCSQGPTGRAEENDELILDGLSHPTGSLEPEAALVRGTQRGTSPQPQCGFPIESAYFG